MNSAGCQRPDARRSMHLTMRFGGLTAVDDLSFKAARGEITALIGPNGAGKTTVFNCITGFYKPTEGDDHAHARRWLVVPARAARRFPDPAAAKVARTFQNIRLFSGMTCLENLLVAQHNALMRASGFTVAGLLGLPSYARRREAAVETARRLAGDDRPGATAPTMRPAICPMATSAGWRSPARCARARSCSASTNRPPASIRAKARSSTSAAVDPRRGAASRSC